MAPRGRPKTVNDITIRCQTCGRSFTVTGTAGAGRRFCSNACYGKSRLGTPAVRGKPITGRPKRSEDKEYTCRNCGKHYVRPEWEKTGKLYCSRACYFADKVHWPPQGPKTPGVERICPNCGKTFLVGGADRARRGQVHCSDACYRASRSQRVIAGLRQLSMVQAAYLAGMIDGEGNINMRFQRGHIAITLAVSNNKRVVLDWMAERTGVGAVTNARPATERHAASYYWQVHGKAAGAVLRQVRPYLMLKGAQADLAVDALTRLQDSMLRLDPVWQKAYVDRCQTLNRRGPP